MKKFLVLACFVFCVGLVNFASLNILTQAKKYGEVEQVLAYSCEEPKNTQSLYCSPFYVFNGLESTDVKIVGETLNLKIAKSDLAKLVYCLNANLVKVEKTDKTIYNLYSNRLNTVSPITTGGELVNMQIVVEGDRAQIGVPSLCGFI